ncbi:hypothetical protein PVAP13_2KG566350 [Panicum virgatum]|uniref:Uncharacterized protein n=1 Tax=Panicum virgatum TaxID=38727 RepID=A0A8T0WME1_PANVG|nr:hypothetical protein PVAP13_2KG566350 [Panicum virgatum]
MRNATAAAVAREGAPFRSNARDHSDAAASFDSNGADGPPSPRPTSPPTPRPALRSAVALRRIHHEGTSLLVALPLQHHVRAEARHAKRRNKRKKEKSVVLKGDVTSARVLESRRTEQ